MTTSARRVVTVVLLVEGEPNDAAEFGHGAVQQLGMLATTYGLRVQHGSWDARLPTREQNLALTPRKVHLADPHRPQQGVCGCFTVRKLRTKDPAVVTCRLCQHFMQRHPATQQALPLTDHVTGGLP